LIGFISDLHLAAEEKTTFTRFEQWLDGLGSKLSSLYILGDLFEFWVGDDAAGWLGYGPVVKCLKALTKAGINLYFLPGNRDFLVAENFARQTGCQLLGDGTVVKINNTRVLLMHGDSLCTDDTEHQQFRSMVNQASWQGEFLARPQTQRIQMAHKARQLSRENKRQKTMAIMDVNQTAVNQAMEDFAVHVLIHGHTHRPGIHDWVEQGQLRRRIVLGAWFTTCSVLLLSDDGLCLTPGPLIRTGLLPE